MFHRQSNQIRAIMFSRRSPTLRQHLRLLSDQHVTHTTHVAFHPNIYHGQHLPIPTSKITSSTLRHLLPTTNPWLNNQQPNNARLWNQPRLPLRRRSLHLRPLLRPFLHSTPNHIIPLRYPTRTRTQLLPRPTLTSTSISSIIIIKIHPHPPLRPYPLPMSQYHPQR